ncbi:hypothetical protein E4U61_004394 [Claviceps capensis]|nr:hypothetical protein E4U61_004394 [Claviceps capensis]
MSNFKMTPNYIHLPEPSPSPGSPNPFIQSLPSQESAFGSSGPPTTAAPPLLPSPLAFSAHGSFARNIGGHNHNAPIKSLVLVIIHYGSSRGHAARAIMTLRGDFDDHQQQHSHINDHNVAHRPEIRSSSSGLLNGSRSRIRRWDPGFQTPETSEEVESGKNGSEKDESKNLEGVEMEISRVGNEHSGPSSYYPTI